MTETLSCPGARGVLPQPGETFGHYRIGRLLGEGGMGAVFEAEDLDNGRYVALKVLGQRLDSPEARSRFLREGRLAASVNHPNSVYVFGTEDVAGVPVIAMEVVAGGTLQDRVVRRGPMPVEEAVDSGLQIIAGLEAAQQVGVLHRDIKPSNCFVEPDGSIKIGDFGLSISTLVRTEPAITVTGTFLGTPAFASPEQLRGDELTVRSDIYSVGITLYFLLTGRLSFDAPDVVRLLAMVLERKADSPAKWRPGLPPELCRVVLRCLEKDPEKRFRNYDELRKALLPYASTAPPPAPLRLRFAAYILDLALLALPITFAKVLARLASGSAQAGNVRLPEAILTQLTVDDSSAIFLHNLCGTAIALIYYTWLEGTWGASVGKRLFGLRVARLDHSTPGWRRALVRALIISGVPTFLWLLGWYGAHTWSSGSAFQVWVAGIALVLVPIRLAIFATARKRNGYAGIHDLLSATRVVFKAAYQPRPALPPGLATAPELKTLPLIGPYYALEQIGSQNGTELLLGFDARLLRRVWIRRQPPGAPGTPATLRQLSRPGRLRWLTARRTDSEAWDAYEALTGESLLSVIAQPQEWARVRYWLIDLAEELLAATQDGTMPAALSLERVWITHQGRAKLLDFDGPKRDHVGQSQAPRLVTVAPSPQQFLKLVAASAMQGSSTPLPLHASRFLEMLKPEADLNRSVAELRPLLPLPARISRARRAVLLGGALAFPIVIAVLGWGIVTFKRDVLAASPELATLNECLTHYNQLQRDALSDPRHVEDLDAFEIYIADRFAHLVTNTAHWNSPLTKAVIAPRLREQAEQILSHKRSAETSDLAAASARLEQFFKKTPELAAREALQTPNLFLGALAIGYGITVLLVIVPCLIASLLFRGGAITALLGIVLVDRHGVPASRFQIAARNLLAWLPFVLIPATTKMHETLPFAAALVVICLTGISLLLPKRGLQDMLAGTWPVPR